MIITGCQKIENCAYSTLANQCSQCKTSKGYGKNAKFYAFGDVFYNRCVQVKTPNCFIALEDSIKFANTPIRNCEICNPGYFLNYDG